MKIDELCEYAKESQIDELKFKFTNLKGEVKNCKWLDPYFGMFIIEGNEGFITTRQWKKLTNNVFEFEIEDW